MRRLFTLALLVLGSLGTSGCFSLVDWNHNLNHFKIWNDNLSNIHRDVDYYFFDYDWDDPTKDLAFETPNTR